MSEIVPPVAEKACAICTFAKNNATMLVLLAGVVCLYYYYKSKKDA